MSALATVRAAPGLDAYLDVLELRLERAVGSHPGLVGRIGAETLAAGGKRLRPVLVFLAVPPDERGGERPLAAGAAVELVHMATLVHDDLLDAAALRRGRPTVWATHGPSAAAGAPATTSSPGRSPSSPGPAMRPRCCSSPDAALSLARGEALQRRQAYRPDTSVEEYLPAARSRPGSCSRRRACSAAGPGSRRVRPRARRRVPDRRRHPRLHGRRGLDGQGARRRPARRNPDAAAHPRRPRGSRGRPRARGRAGPRRARARRRDRGDRGLPRPGPRVREPRPRGAQRGARIATPSRHSPTLW